MREVAVPLLVGHLAYGLILGIVWGRIMRDTPARPAAVVASVPRAA